MLQRPCIGKKIDELELLFKIAKSDGNIQVVRMLANELRFRDSSRADTLKASVEKFLAIIDTKLTDEIGSMTQRPYLGKKIDEIEQIFETIRSNSDTKIAKILLSELHFRDAPRAKTLKAKVENFLAMAHLKPATIGSIVSTNSPQIMSSASQFAPEIQTSELIKEVEVAQDDSISSKISTESTIMSDQMILQRLQGLLAFVKQTATLRGNPPRTIEQHSDFKRYENDLRGLPGVAFDLSSSEDDVWLQVDRLHETQPPKPSSVLLNELIVHSKSQITPPTLKSVLTREQLILLRIEVPDVESDQDKTKPVRLDTLSIKDQAEAELSAYIAGPWQSWATQERDVRKTISLYTDLFAVHQKLQGNIVETPLELLIGIGVAVWAHPNGSIQYPLISKLVEVSINDLSHAIEIRPRTLDARVELDAYTAMDNPGVSAMAKAAKEFFIPLAGQVSPFEPSTFEPILKTAVGLLDSKGVYWPDVVEADDRKLPSKPEHLNVTDTWALFVRPRNSSLFIQDLERFETLVEKQPDLASLSPAVLSLVADPKEVIDDSVLTPYRGLSNIDVGAGNAGKAKNLFFPMPYNDEQVQIIQMLDSNDGVVVQGPPGTGKTHTIANVISHYLACGKRVLVTSMKDPALAVLQEKLPKDIRPLAISLLSSEADGMKQFEHSINKIASEVSRINRADMAREVTQLDHSIDELHARISAVEKNIALWAKKNLESVEMDKELLKPLDIAREVTANAIEAAWMTDALTIQPEHAPIFDNSDITALRDARRELGDDLHILVDKLPAIDGFPETDKLLQVHLDLSRLAELNAQVTSAAVPVLRDMEQATIESALLAVDKVKNLKHVRQTIDGIDAAWVAQLERVMRLNSGSDDMLNLFRTLRSEILDALNYRKIFVTKPVQLPEGVMSNLEIIVSIENLSLGLKPFGLSGLFGKNAEKKLIGSITVLNSKPASVEDWNHVLQYIRFTQSCENLRARWNALSEELPIPSLDSAQDLISKGSFCLSTYDQIGKLVVEEKHLSTLLEHLLPEWRDVQEIPFSCDFLGTASDILDHNLTRNRLAQTWRVKDNFLRAMTDCHGHMTDAIKLFLETQLGSADFSEAEIQSLWSKLLLELRRLHALAPQLRTVRDVVAKIEGSGAIKWAEKLRTLPMSSSSDDLLPDNWRHIWRLRRLLTLVEQMDGREDLARLSSKRSELESDLAKHYQQAVTTRTWLKLAEKAVPSVRSALEAYRTAISRIGKGTGIRAPRFRKDAREAAEKASPAIPCWIMPHYRVCESLPVELGAFDLVIIDEASQSDLTALPAILRAKKVLIVGDDKQVSPDGVGLEEEKIRSLMNQHLGDQVGIYRAQMSPDRSIYDLFKVVFAKGMVMLREHFRCVEPIIEYSKREFYDHELRPLRLPQRSERLDPPLIDVHVTDGSRGDGKSNLGEARFIVDEIKKIAADPAMKKRSIGVVSLVGNEQTKLVWDLVSRELGEAIIERHHIAFGDARTFQGKERDIMFLSMVVSGKTTAASTHLFAQRYNVAASRARDRMYLVRSILLEELSPADAMRRKLIEHFHAPYLQNEDEVKDHRSLCESDFEREVFDVLVERGYRVVPQVRVGSYRIDLVVEGNNDTRLAVECDGDRYHGPDQWDHDMRRQRVLERAGWKFWRCFASTFTLHRLSVIDNLVSTLKSHGVEPVGAADGVKSIHSQFISYSAFKHEVIEEDELTS